MSGLTQENQSPQFRHVFIGADHAGFEIKEALKAHMLSLGLSHDDFGCDDLNAVDYPDVAAKVSEAVLVMPDSMGVLCCGSGVGMSIAANRYNGLRAVLAFDSHVAELSRLHNNANILCLGGRITAEAYAQEIFEVFLNGVFEGERHMTRINKLDRLVSSGDLTSCPSSTC